MPDLEASYTQAYALYQSGRNSRAAHLFRSLCAEAPLEYRFWFGLGSCLQESREFQNALQAWAMAALLDPKNPYPHFHAAECACSLNQMKEAGLALKEAKARLVDPNHPLRGPIEVLEEQWRNR